MVIAVANRGKGLTAVVALVRLLTGVDTHVYQQVAPLIEGLVAPHAPEARCIRIADVHHDVATLRCPAHRFLVLSIFLTSKLEFGRGREVRHKFVGLPILLQAGAVDVTLDGRLGKLRLTLLLGSSELYY